jgi:hypothetical protein
MLLALVPVMWAHMASGVKLVSFVRTATLRMISRTRAFSSYLTSPDVMAAHVRN